MQRKINMKKRKHSELKSYMHSKKNSTLQEIFIQAQQYPSFFNQNLIDDDRKIKIFLNNVHTHQIIFYFQLLKLTFEVDNQDYQKYLIKIYDLIDNTQFQLYEAQINDEYYVPLTSNKIKKMIQQYLDEMGQGAMYVIDGLLKYPIISILINGGVCNTFGQKLQVKETYEFLAHYFQIQLTFYESCLRFNQTDIFAYFQSQDQIYLAYISPKEEIQLIKFKDEMHEDDDKQDFNISSVKQMISQIDIPIEGSFNLSSNKNDQILSNDIVEYSYSNSSHLKKRLSKSIQSNSDLKFSHLALQEFNSSQISSLNKENHAELLAIDKKNIVKNQKLIFQIEEVPFELQNLNSPFNTPRNGAKNNFRQQRFEKTSQKQNKFCSKLTDPSFTEEECEDNSKTKKRKFRDYNSQAMQDNKNNMLKYLIYKGKNEEQQSMESNQKRCPTLKSIYFRSVNTINQLQSQSILAAQNYLQQKIQAKRLKKQSSFVPEHQSRFKQNTKIMLDVSKQFTNSIIIKQMREPFQSHIRQIKERARKNRCNIQQMIHL